MGRRNLSLEGGSGSGEDKPKSNLKVWQWAGETQVLKEGLAGCRRNLILKEGLAVGRRNLSLEERSGSGQEKPQF